MTAPGLTICRTKDMLTARMAIVNKLDTRTLLFIYLHGAT